MFAARLKSNSENVPGQLASIPFRVVGQDAGSRRRGSTQPQLHVAVGGSFQAIAKFINSTGAPTDRSRWIAPDLGWQLGNPKSCWGRDDVSFLRGTWRRLSKVGADILCPERRPLDAAELIISFSRKLLSPAASAMDARLRPGPTPLPRTATE